MPEYVEGVTLLMQICDGSENQKWVYIKGIIRHSVLPLCVDSRYHSQRGVTAEKCDQNRGSQRWMRYNHGLDILQEK